MTCKRPILRSIAVVGIVCITLGKDPLHADPVPSSNPDAWAIVMCRFLGGPIDPRVRQETIDRPFLEDLFTEAGAGKGGMFDWWLQQSYGALDLGETIVRGWYELPYPRAAAPARTTVWQDCAALAQNDIHFPSYYGIAVVMSEGFQTFGGLSPASLNGQTRWYGMEMSDPYGLEPTIVAQEMAHGYGILDHTWSANPDVEYGDPWDPMSAWTRGYFFDPADSPDFGRKGPGFTGYNRKRLGWLPPYRVYRAGGCSTTTLTLEALERASYSAGTALVEIPRSDGSYYTVEFRARRGWDAAIPEEAVLVHHIRNGRSYLVPNAGSRFVNGDSFEDAAEGIEVHVTSINSAAATAEVVVTLPLPQSVCGNGLTEGCEECDDGNTLAGDCCSPACRLDGPGTPCSPDSDVTTSDACDGSGVCLHFVPRVPPSRCRPALKATLKLTPPSHCPDDPTAPPKLTWTWLADTMLAKQDFGTPTTTTDHSFAVIDASGNAPLSLVLPAGGMCGSQACWRETGTGFKYKRSDATGVVAAKMKAGAPGRGKVTLKSRPAEPGCNLPVPDLDSGYFFAGIESDVTCLGSAFWNATIDAKGKLKALTRDVVKPSCAQVMSVSSVTPEAGPILNPVNGHAYFLLSPNTWSGAESDAVGLFGHLVTINDAAENRWVWETFAPLGGGPFWIGLTDAAQEGSWVWTSGEPVTYVGWWSDNGEPNDLGGIEHYAELNNYLWNDNRLGTLLRAVAEVECVAE